MAGGMRLRDDKMVLPEKNRDELDLGETGEEGAPLALTPPLTPPAAAGWRTHLVDVCFHILIGERE